MDRKHHGSEHSVSNDRWMVSYADFVTLLFALFVVLFATAMSDKTKPAAVSQSVLQAIQRGAIALFYDTEAVRPQDGKPAKGGGGAELAPSLEVLTKNLRDEISAGKVEVRLEPRGLVISMRQAAFFESGQATINTATYPIIDKLAAVVSGLPNAVRLEGHTDSVPISNARFQSNWELSAARAIQVLELFVGRYNIPRGRLAVVGYAETIPLASNELPEGRARNRRVDVVLLNQQALALDAANGSIHVPAAGKKLH